MLEKLQNIDSNSETTNDEDETTDLSDHGNPNAVATEADSDLSTES
jgi:hypothetical protein